MPDDDAPAAPAADAPADMPAGPVVFLGVLFVVTIGLSIATAATFEEEVGAVFEDADSLANPLIYLGMVLAFTLVILLIAKYGPKSLIQIIVLAAVLMTMVYVFWPLGEHYIGGPETMWIGISLALSVALTVLLWVHPEWYVIDSAGVIVGVGATALFGISFGLLPALLLLVAFAVYDFIAVYRTKHMIDLADAVMTLHLPVMLVAPKVRHYSFLKERRLKDKLEKKEGRDALFMGLGDIVIPGILVVSAYHFLAERIPLRGTGVLPGHLVVAVATLVGTLVGFVVLMRAVLKGRAHAGLPSLNGGAIAAFLVATSLVFGPSAIRGGCTGPPDVTIESRDNSIALAWSSLAGAETYRVHRAAENATSVRLVHEGAGTWFEDAGVARNVTYQYWVTATAPHVETGRCGVVTMEL